MWQIPALGQAESGKVMTSGKIDNGGLADCER